MQIVFQSSGHNNVMVDVVVPFDKTPHEVELEVSAMAQKILGQWDGKFSNLDDLVGATMSALPHLQWRWCHTSTIVIARRRAH